MKKWISALLVVVMILTSAIPAFAKETAQETTTYPIIFVTGIGQTWSHLLNEDGSYVLEKDGSVLDYNLFYADTQALKQPRVILHLLKIVGGLVSTLVIGRNCVNKDDVGVVMCALLNKNLIDENGQLPKEVEPCLHKYPISEYNKMELDDFYYSIPCQSMVEEIGAQNIYCYNHSAFSFLYDDADGLDDFIQNTVLPQSKASQVVLIPMSMGAAVVSAYLERFGDKNQVKRVVSIVGAWYGSDVLGDLILMDYTPNAPELLYNGVLADFIGKPAGYLVNIALRIFPKKALRGVIDSVLAGVVENFVAKTPSLISVSPYYDYEAIEQRYLSTPDMEYIQKQCREYYNAQTTLLDRLHHLENTYGTEFYFICGYGLEFGEGSGQEYGLFQFMKSNDTTNSDEIIQISSTAPGATCAPAGETLGYTGKYVSPDGSVDLSTSFAPDRTWCFYRQKHELEYNNTALRLALDISTGKVTGVEQSKDQYPQFNDSRDLKRLVRGDGSYMKKLENYIENHPTETENIAKAQAMLDKCNQMINSTVNNRADDDALIQEARNLLVELGEENADKESTKVEKFFYNLAEKANDTVYRIFGAKGFSDYRPWSK